MSESDISKLIKISQSSVQLPDCTEYTAELRIAYKGYIDKEANEPFTKLANDLKSQVLNTVHKDTIDTLQKLIYSYIAATQRSPNYDVYLAYAKVVEDLQKLIRELRGL